MSSSFEQRCWSEPYYASYIGCRFRTDAHHYSGVFPFQVGQFVQAFGYRTADRRGCSQLSISNSPLIPPSLSHTPLIETIYVRCDFELRSVANPRNARSEAPALDSLQVTDVHKMTHLPPDQYNDV